MSKIIFLLLLFSTGLFAGTNHMVIMGGGAEPLDKETTIFDEEMKLLGKYVKKKKDWSVSLSFNGGHSKTEQILEKSIEKVTGPNTAFTESSFENLIATYEKKIKNSEIKSGDQLILYLSTHGAIKSKNESTHSIAVSGGASANLNNLSNSKIVSMDRLKNLSALAKSKGIKLGILDFSCHSGASLALKNDNTCVISASGPDHFGFALWGSRFADNMKQGKNLEEVFLETFKNRPEMSFPMISSPAGVEIQEELYKLMTPYLYFWRKNPGQDKFAKLIEDQVNNNKCEEANFQFNELMTLLGQMENVVRKVNGEAPDFRRLKDALSEYHDFQNSVKEKYAQMGAQDIYQKKEKFCSQWDKNKTCTEWSLKEILTMQYDKLINLYGNIKAKKSGPIVGWYDAYISNLDQAKERREQLLSSNPELSEKINFFQTIPKLEKTSWDMSLRVSKELQKVYSSMYSSKTESNNRPNPCRDIVL